MPVLGLCHLRCGSGIEPYLDHLMFTLSPATTHSSLAVSPSGTVTVDGSPVIVSSPGPREGALLATMPSLPNLCHLPSQATGPSHPPIPPSHCTLPRTLSWTHRWSRSCPLKATQV